MDVLFSKEDKAIILDNIYQNVTQLAEEYPKTEFMYFISPFSIGFWDSLHRRGEIKRQLEIEKVAIEVILKQPNIKLYSFNNNFELICNLNDYKDEGHYGEWVNTDILQWMSEESIYLRRRIIWIIWMK